MHKMLFVCIMHEQPSAAGMFPWQSPLWHNKHAYYFISSWSKKEELSNTRKLQKKRFLLMEEEPQWYNSITVHLDLDAFKSCAVIVNSWKFSIVPYLHILRGKHAFFFKGGLLKTNYSLFLNICKGQTIWIHIKCGEIRITVLSPTAEVCNG